MIRNYFTSLLRHLQKDKLYTTINTFGLAVGLTTCFVIFNWVANELSYEGYHTDADHIYRVVTGYDGTDEAFSSTYPMMKERVLEQFPEIELSTRIYNQGLLGGQTRINIGDKVFTDNTLYYVDSTFFSLFPYRIIARQSKNLFAKKNAVVLTQKTAFKIFGTDDPIGKVITLDNKTVLEVTGVMEDIPVNTHFNFDLIASMQSHPWVKGAEERVWSGIVFHTYVKVKSGTDIKRLETQIDNFLAQLPNDPNGHGKTLNMMLQPIKDIHLTSHYKFELQPNGNETYVYLFISIAILIIVIACMNYINLSTARYTQRIKEVGVRKVLGAARKQLITQFMGETLVIAFLSFFIAAVAIQLLRPIVFQISGYDFLPTFSESAPLFGMMALGTLIVGLISGIFPAFMLSSFKPIKLMKPGMAHSPKGNTLRKSLVVIQFSISIILTICTVLTYRQLQFIQNKNLGYDKEHIIVLPIEYDEVKTKYQALKEKLLSNASILSASATSQLPSNIQEQETIDLPGNETYGVYYISVDEDFFKTMNIPLLEGKEQIENLDPESGMNRFVLNETALKNLNWETRDALQKQIAIRHGNMQPGEIIGIASDFNFQSLHVPLSALVIEFTPELYDNLLVKVKADHVDETLAYIHNVWKEFAGNIPFDYKFLDMEYNNLYQNEKRVGSLFVIFATIASILALLGLFGLASFAVEKRTKEIGVRKVLGASLTDILHLLTRDFSRLILVAFCIAAPIAYYFMSTWLTNFAYQVPFNIWIFIAAGLVNFLLALFTLTYHGLKAGQTDPVSALKYE